MCFQAARFPARTGPNGLPILLPDQDRALWDAELMTQGMGFLQTAQAELQRGRYLLEAAIAAAHCAAPSYAQTDWPTVLLLYNELQARYPSPAVALNRVVALSHAQGPDLALTQLEHLAETTPTLLGQPHYHAVRADLLYRLGQLAEALAALEAALAAAPSPADHALLERRQSQWQLAIKNL